MRYFFTLLPLLLFLQSTAAQQTYTVIAVSGLTLRATPGKQGKALAVAPMGSKVAVLTDTQLRPGQGQYVRRDTIGLLEEKLIRDGSAYVRIKTPHIGYWWQVRYKGKTGYMFSGFLAGGQELENHYSDAQVNDLWRLQAPGGNACASMEIDFQKKWNWYGLFRQENGQFSLQAVRLSYKTADYSDENGRYDMIHREVVVQAADVPRQPLFLIGSRNTMTERADISGQYAYHNYGGMSVFLTPDGQPDAQLLRAQGVLVKDAPDLPGGHTLSLENPAGKPQELLLRYQERDYTQSPGELLWVGDLDNDGRRDYIFDSPGEIGAYMLYLSSRARSGEAAGLTALMWHWYCC